MNGRLASIIGPVDLTPGISALASCGSGPGAQSGFWAPEQNAELSALNAGIAAWSVLGSAATAFSSETFSRANEFAVVLKFVIRFWRTWGWVLIAPETVPWSLIAFERSWGSMPSASCATTAEYSYAGSQYLIDALKDGPPFFSAVPNCWSSVCRFCRVFVCSEVST